MSAPVRCELIGWNRFYGLARRLARLVRDSGYRPQTLVGIGRGGYLPARVLSDFLEVSDLTSFKIEHYDSTRKRRTAVVRYPLAADLSGRRVLLVDDVSDSGDTFETAVAHVRGLGAPAEIRTAVLHHKTISRFVPDYYVTRVVKWRWIVYPWAIAEDLATFIGELQPRPHGIEETAARLRSERGIRVAPAVLRDVLAMIEARTDARR